MKNAPQPAGCPCTLYVPTVCTNCGRPFLRSPSYSQQTVCVRILVFRCRRPSRPVPPGGHSLAACSRHPLRTRVATILTTRGEPRLPQPHAHTHTLLGSNCAIAHRASPRAKAEPSHAKAGTTARALVLSPCRHASRVRSHASRCKPAGAEQAMPIFAEVCHYYKRL